jgi:hypothetical protein
MRNRTAADREAVQRGHRRLARAELWDPDSGFICEVPFTQGSVDFSLSRSTGDRAGTLSVPGYTWEPLLSPATYRWLVITIDIDRRRWNLGEFPIISTEVSTPGGLVRVTAGDWCYRRQRDVAENPQDSLILGTTIARMAEQHLTHAMPWPVTAGRDDTGGAMMPSEAKITGGGDVWAAMQKAAGLADARLVMPDRQTVELRRYDPDRPVDEDLEGLVIRGTRTISAAKGDACNKVIVTVDGADQVTYRSVQTLREGSAYDYGKDGFGRAQIVENIQVMDPSQAAADAEAERIANRRFGAMKSVDVQVPVLPWLEVGDRVSLRIGGVVEKVHIETLTMPLTANQSMRLTGRDAGWRFG